MTHHRIDPSELVVPQILDLFEKVHKERNYPVDEAEVTRCLNPADGFPQDVSWGYKVIALVRTSILHVVDGPETQNMIYSAATGADSPETELPHLPFPRVAIEAEDTQGWKIKNQYDNEFAIYAIFISERVPGLIWDCCWYWGDFTNSDRPYGNGYEPFLWWSIHMIDGKPVVKTQYDQDLQPLLNPHQQETTTSLTAFCIELAHVIGAKNVPHEPVSHVSRQQRRHWHQHHNYEVVKDGKPRIYFVNLHAAGETHEQQQANGSRIYTCRWLVKGHWRHYGKPTKSGRNFTAKSVWIKPYVKGPVGAPWKGRPIYRDDA